MSTPDAMLGGRLVLRQAANGHRAGTDAALLAALAPADAAGLLIDAGAGSGMVGLAIALRCPALQVHLCDIDASSVALADENLALNGLAARGRAVLVDVTRASERRAAGLADDAADYVATNPPYLEAGGRLSPDLDRARAHAMATPDGLERWVRGCCAMLRPGGLFMMIHRADALGCALAVMQGRFGAIVMRAVHARAATPAIRVLLAARKGSRAKLVIAPPLVLHEADGRFTPLAQAVHDGRALITA